MKKLFLIFLCLISYQSFANRIYIPMNADDQKNHLKAYGIAFNSLILNMPVEWLLNYDGGAFVCAEAASLKKLCILRDVSFKVITENEYQAIINTISQPDFNGEIVKLDKAPHIAVYTPDSKLPWDDAVTMALTYADISYDKIYDKEIVEGKLANYNWLHLHHEDFTGQYGKFWQAYQHADWYIADVKAQETMAKSLGYNKVSQLKLAVSKKIKDFVFNGGYLFAMCTATDSYDIALSADGVDICEPPFDGDGITPNAQGLLNFNNTFAFENYKIFTQPNFYEFSDIDNTLFRGNINPQIDYFSLFTFAAKVDLVPAMLTQNHTTMIKGFMGQTTAFQLNKIKSNVTILGSNDALKEAKYIHGNAGKGTFTFYGGHDPEDYQHAVGDPPTDLDVHPNSPGYRLILNNVLFPAAKKKPRKT